MGDLEIYIIGALDAKVELNRETNETLSAMAQAIFKSWFIDFDPVHARARGQAPVGTDAHTATLFPDGFQEVPVGRIPYLWTVVPLEELTSKIASGVSVEPNDILLDITGASILRVRIVDPEFSPAKISQHAVVIRAKPTVPPCFIFLFLRDRGIQNYLPALATGAAAKAHVRSLPVLLPPQALLERFDELIAPMLGRIENNNAQSKQIACFRDILLLRLRSGEFSVAEIEDILRSPHRSTPGGIE